MLFTNKDKGYKLVVKALNVVGVTCRSIDFQIRATEATLYFNESETGSYQ